MPETTGGSDPFAGAKASLRDTVKWLATAFAGVGAVVLAGTSLTGVAGVEGYRLVLALTGGGLGLVCVFAATGILLQLLMAESFFLSQIGTDPQLKGLINNNAIDVLPPEFSTLDEFLDFRTQAIATIRANKGAPGSEAYKEASDYFSNSELPISRLVNLAHFELLRRNIRHRRWHLFGLAVGALVGLGLFAFVAGAGKKDPIDASRSMATFSVDPGKDWSELAKAFTSACGPRPPFRAQLIGTPQPGWITLSLLSPDACAGVLISVPARLAPGPSPG